MLINNEKHVSKDQRRSSQILFHWILCLQQAIPGLKRGIRGTVTPLPPQITHQRSSLSKLSKTPSKRFFASPSPLSTRALRWHPQTMKTSNFILLLLPFLFFTASHVLKRRGRLPGGKFAECKSAFGVGAPPSTVPPYLRSCEPTD